MEETSQEIKFNIFLEDQNENNMIKVLLSTDYYESRAEEIADLLEKVVEEGRKEMKCSHILFDKPVGRIHSPDPDSFLFEPIRHLQCKTSEPHGYEYKLSPFKFALEPFSKALLELMATPCDVSYSRTCIVALNIFIIRPYRDKFYRAYFISGLSTLTNVKHRLSVSSSSEFE